MGLLAAPLTCLAHGPGLPPAGSPRPWRGLHALGPEREPLPGREALDAWLAAHAAAKPLAPARAAQDDIAVGTQLPFAIAGLPFLLTASCQYVGNHAYIFVEDASWDLNGGSVLQSHVDALGRLFDASTPADASRGVYELAVTTFGEPPDVDGYERIFLLILDIPDPRMVGYFDPAVAMHEVPELRRDVIHLDEAYVRLRSYTARGTLAHEFQHLIHWGLDADEDLWINEGLSGYAEAMAGYAEADSSAVPAFLKQPGIALMEWANTAQNYGMTYLFAAFLAEKYGRPAIRHLVAEPRNGAPGIDRALAAAGSSDGFEEVWSRWLVGNYAGDDGENGYAALRGRRVATLSVEALPLDWSGAPVSGQWGSTTVVFRTPGDLTVQLDGGGTGLFRAWVYAMRQGVGQVQEMVLDGDNRGALTAAGIDSLALIVGRTSRAGREFEVAAARAIPTAVAAADARPGVTHLAPAYPNPFNSTVRLPLVMAAAGAVQLTVYDALGRPVRVLHRGHLAAGRHELVWDSLDRYGRAAASGPYLVRLERLEEDGSPTGARYLARVTLLR